MNVFYQTSGKVNEQRRVEVLHRYKILDTEPEESFNRIAVITAKALGTKAALISFVDDQRVYYKAATGMIGAQNTDRHSSLCSIAVEEDHVTVFEDAAIGQFIEYNSELRFYAGAPISTPDGFRIGVLSILDTKGRIFSEFQKELLKEMAALVTDQIELRLETHAALEERSLQLQKEKNAKAEAEEQRDLLHQFFMLSPNMISILKGPDHVYTLVNPHYQAMFADRQLLGLPIMEALPELEGQGIKELLDKVYQSGVPVSFEALPVELDLDGKHQIRYFTFTYAPHREKTEISGVIVFASDVTALITAQKAADAGKQRLINILELLPQLSWTGTPAGKFDYLNKGWEKYSGKNNNYFYEHGLQSIIHEDDRALYLARKDEVLNKSKTMDIQLRLRDSTGDYQWFLCRSMVLKDEEGKVEIWVGSCTNIHSQVVRSKDLEEMIGERNSELLVNNRELKRSNADLEQFAYVASHDLMEPLRMITSYVQLIETKYSASLDKDVAEYMSFVVEGTRRMGSLLKDLLTYSRIGRTQDMLKPVNFNEVMDKVIADLDIAIKDNGAEIIYPVMPVLPGIELLLVQLFENLIANAIKFRKENEPPIIKLACERKDDFWHFSVSDNGIGIDAYYKDKIFVIFQRLHDRSKYEGTGIGLANCKKIVELFGGTIWVESALGQGSTFHFTIKV